MRRAPHSVSASSASGATRCWISWAKVTTESAASTWASRGQERRSVSDEPPEQVALTDAASGSCCRMCLPSRTARPESLKRLSRRSSPPRPVASQPATSSEPRPARRRGFEACADKRQIGATGSSSARRSSAMSCSERSSGCTMSSAAATNSSARCSDPGAARSGQAVLARVERRADPAGRRLTDLGETPLALSHERSSRRWPELLVVDRDRPDALEHGSSRARRW